MMRKRNIFGHITKILFMSVLAVSLMTGCGSKATEEQEKVAEQQKMTNQQGTEQQENAVQGETTNQQETEGQSENAEQQMADEQTNAETVSNGDIDVDLTQLSSTLVYSEVYNMLSRPDDYIGKTVKMNGSFSVYEDEETGKVYFACYIADATACCSQGIEFTLSGEHVYPDDYPEVGSEIVVQGIFETYEENGYLYCQLKDAVME